MDLTTIEGLIPIAVAVFSVVSAWYAMKLAAAKNADAVQALHDRLENLGKQIAALWQKKDEAVETKIEVKYLRRDVDKVMDKMDRNDV
jgi:hypothetical protein